jgi:hypothetical protein
MHESNPYAARPSVAGRVIAVPAGDVEFARDVRDSIAADLDITSLEDRLRLRYPRARVRRNELSGRDAVWYAYRDGRWEPARAT